MVAKINELIDAVSELQQTLDGLHGATVVGEVAPKKSMKVSASKFQQYMKTWASIRTTSAA